MRVEWIIFLKKCVYCLSGLGIVRKNRRQLKYFMGKYGLLQINVIVFILISVLSLRSFNHEFTRFLKKHYPWNDLTNKNTQPPELFETIPFQTSCKSHCSSIDRHDFFRYCVRTCPKSRVPTSRTLSSRSKYGEWRPC